MMDNNLEAQRRKQRSSWLLSIDFYKSIDSFYELIDRLSYQNTVSIKFLNFRKRIICPSIGMNAVLYSLKGIISLCEIGDIIDSYVLLRKIRDSLYLDLFFISESLSDKPNHFEFSKSFDEMSQEEIMNEVIKFLSYAIKEEDKDENIQKISRWFDGDYSSADMKKTRISLFSFSAFKKKIEEKYNVIKKCHDFYLTKLFDKLDNGLNNYVHSNGPSFISNDVLVLNKTSFLNAVKDLLMLLGIIKRIFLIDLFFIDSTLFQTDDYKDAVEMGMVPVEDSQYNVIYQVVEEFENINIDNPELYNYLKSNNRFNMNCFYKNKE